MTNEIISALERLDNAKTMKEATLMRKKSIIDEIIGDKNLAEIECVEAEFEVDVKSINDTIKRVKAEVKKLAINHGETVKGEYLQVIPIAGRIKWDGEGLNNLKAVRPDVWEVIQVFRSTGKPYAQIRNVSK